MTKYQLAKLVEWAENHLKTRKRLQKVVYLLQAAGCDLGADFRLHYYGPYSEEVATVTDDLVRRNLLSERPHENLAGTQYEYALTDLAKDQLAEAESKAAGRRAAEQLAPFEDLGRRLLRMDLRELEIAATIAYFKRKEETWSKAVESACRFKSLATDAPVVRTAAALAKEVLN